MNDLQTVPARRGKVVLVGGLGATRELAGALTLLGTPLLEVLPMARTGTNPRTGIAITPVQTGPGGNAINDMIKSEMLGVDFVAANSDSMSLERNLAPIKIQLGPTATKGLGAGGNPEVGREATREEADRIRQVLDGADMVFIAAGMGGGTGTGAAPVVAETAKQVGAETDAVFVSVPLPGAVPLMR